VRGNDSGWPLSKSEVGTVFDNRRRARALAALFFVSKILPSFGNERLIQAESLPIRQKVLKLDF
jgi:hypothetical protein